MRGFMQMIVAVSLLCVALGPAAAPPSASDPGSSNAVESLVAKVSQLETTVASLRTDVDDLMGQVKSLQAAPTEDSDTTAVAANGSIRVMTIEKVDELPVDVAAVAEATRMKDTADSKEAEAVKLDQQKEKLIDVRPSDWTYWSDTRKEAYQRQVLENKRRRDELANQAVKFRTEAKSIRGKAAKIEKEANERRQRITGWDGSQTIILITETDCSRVLHEANATGFVSWRGGSVSNQEGDSQTIRVQRVDTAKAPAGFVARPQRK